jgi:hypothetical protein
MTESLRFSAEPEPGLEIVDILTNAVRRGMMGLLKFNGWRNIRSLMIHTSSHYIRLLALSGSASQFNLPLAYAPMLRHFSSGGKGMLI